MSRNDHTFIREFRDPGEQPQRDRASSARIALACGVTVYGAMVCGLALAFVLGGVA